MARLYRKIAKSVANAPCQASNIHGSLSQMIYDPQNAAKNQDVMLGHGLEPRLLLNTGERGQYLPLSPRDQAVNAVTSMVEETHHAFVLGDMSLQRHLAQIYRELRSNRDQLKVLTQVVHEERRSLQSQTDNDASNEGADASSSDVVDIFFDCVSSFSDDDSDDSLDRSRARFQGSADYLLERRANFIPEQYTTPGRFHSRIILISMLEIGFTNSYRLQRYCLFYLENPRVWRRVIVSATVVQPLRISTLAGISSPDTSNVFKVLPGNLKKQLEWALAKKSLPGSDTHVSLVISEPEPSLFEIEPSHVDVAVDDTQITTTVEAALLRQLNEVGCARFSEREVAVQLRLTVYTQVVQIYGQCLIEHKRPFTQTKHQTSRSDDERQKEFLNDVSILLALREFDAVIKFTGYVLDSTGSRLHSYLCEWPLLGSLEHVLTRALRTGQLIPWAIRETWVKQLITAVAKIHERGIAVGSINRLSVFVHEDGNLVLDNPKTARRTLNQSGRLPPELRSDSYYALSHAKRTLETDVFQLGLLLWCLMEHKVSASGLCPRFECTHKPKSSCPVHSNPIELPQSNNPMIPKYMDDIIRQCRERDPTRRCSARQMLWVLPRETTPVDATLLAAPLRDWEGFKWSVCDECGGFISDGIKFKCPICQGGNFDLCPRCVSEGVHCFVSEHILIQHVLS
ncbi:hypothetical protein N0V83_009503 [Neocucurbitaria cava]|uniref:Protein kinase domain-containing protein n=1 Tax=Neocucurbitaria cava TaxID=798079 RepID=A0A9W8Y2U3_9PLEO|nr:hypothetical protein N0V83_009503 [Neocucurbitaria cava]